MKITWLSQGSFLFEAQGNRILVDPYMSNCLDDKGMERLVEFPLALPDLLPDILICSHNHLDHLDPESVQKIVEAYPNCTIAGPLSSCEHFKKLGISLNQIHKLPVGEKLALPGVIITAVTAHHSEPQAIGLVIETDGKKYYLSADTTYDKDLVNDKTRGSDVVLICINGRLGNMNLEEALAIVKTIKPKTALPMHYGLFAANTADPQPFVDGCKEAGIDSFTMELGKTFEL